MGETTDSPTISTKLERIAKLARDFRGKPLNPLSHFIDEEWLHEGYRRTRKDGATGIDRRSAAEYAENLEGNLRSLLERAKSGTYFAPPVRRVHIPKGDGSQTRPIGIPTFEDKVLQRAVAMVLEAVYEQEFHDFSYGFRPGRSALQASEALQSAAVNMAGGWVLEVDIKRFFGAPGQAWRFQRVKFPPRQGEEPLHRESSLGLMEATTWVKRRQSDARAVTQVKRWSLVKTIRRPTRSKTWKAMVGGRNGRWLPETPAGSESTARADKEASRNLGDPTRSWRSS